MKELLIIFLLSVSILSASDIPDLTDKPVPIPLEENVFKSAGFYRFDDGRTISTKSYQLLMAEIEINYIYTDYLESELHQTEITMFSLSKEVDKLREALEKTEYERDYYKYKLESGD